MLGFFVRCVDEDGLEVDGSERRCGVDDLLQRA
jgi:hypothetical protein